MDLFFFFSERALQPPPVSPAPPPPASISPTSDSGKHPNRRSRKSERPLPTKALPASSVSGTEASLTPSTPKADTENSSSVDKGVTQRHDRDSVDVASKPAISEASSKDSVKDGTEKDVKPLVTTSQLPPTSDQKAALATLPVSPIEAGSSGAVLNMAATSGVPLGEGTEGLPPLLPGRVSLHILMCLCF